MNLHVDIYVIFVAGLLLEFIADHPWRAFLLLAFILLTVAITFRD
jgi:hypothetical protein